ncbi:MAG TPA: S8 family serine peptidase [Candidatus Xenobia bacterium]|nr:S8 family serine peptidase [Candidatus Xenobia bacterium]
MERPGGPRGFLFLALLFALPLAGQQAAPVEPGQTSGEAARERAKYVPDRILVRFKAGAGKRAMDGAHAAYGARVLHSYRAVERLQVVQLPHGMPVEDALAAYRARPDVLYAEPDYLLHIDLTPNDPCFTGNAAGVCPVSPPDPANRDMWGLHNVGTFGGTPDADIDAPAAWDLSTGSPGVVVVVIDTGIDYNHPDLAPNMIQIEADCSDGLDNDINGFIDDCRGIDTVNGDTDPFDDNGHGTHVAGTIGARGNNSTGVVGVNWTVTLMACKFLAGSGSGPTSAAIDCLDYVALMKDRGVNIVATNNSWGGDSFSQALEDAIDAQRARGILFIASAGNSNSNNDTVDAYPTNYFLPNVLSVAATTRNDLRSGFSSFGRRSVHLGAPGTSVLSSVPANGYAFFNGTSMAAPHVTGSVALLKAHDPTRDWRALRSLILTGGDNISALATNTITGKRLNVFGALTCSNSSVQSRLRPLPSSIGAGVGVSVLLSYLSLTCAAPVGPAQVTFDPGGQVITLLDDGVPPDQAAGDGVFSANWIPFAVQPGTLTFPGNDVVNVLFPDLYTVAPAAYSYRDISATGSSLNFGDESGATVTPPFPLQFAGSGFPSVFVSSNGTLNFDAVRIGDYENQAIPSPRLNTIIAPWWDDLFPVSSTARNVFTAVVGSAPNRELVIEWRNVEQFDACSANQPVTFQVVFFENSSDILFNYADTFFAPGCGSLNNGGSATVGVQVGAGLGTQFSFNAATLADNTALLWTIAPAAATPAINAGGAVNAASFVPGPLAPGSIAAVFGTNLASSTAVASAVPLPATLGGASMVFDAVRPAPKFYASPTQVNLQVPWELAGQPSASLTDSVGDSTSGAEMIPLAMFAPGLFATNQQGTSQGAILIANTATFAAPTGSIPGAQARPAVRGVDFLEIYWTGGGPVTNQPASGKGAAANPLSSTTSTPTVTIGGVDAPVLFSGLAPGFVGLYVVTLQVPAGTPTGNSVPVVLTIGGIASNTVTIAVE